MRVPFVTYALNDPAPQMVAEGARSVFAAGPLRAGPIADLATFRRIDTPQTHLDSLYGNAVAVDNADVPGDPDWVGLRQKAQDGNYGQDNRRKDGDIQQPAAPGSPQQSPHDMPLRCTPNQLSLLASCAENVRFWQKIKRRLGNSPETRTRPSARRKCVIRPAEIFRPAR
jgi:hypothetical protein